MNRERIIWSILFLCGAIFLAHRTFVDKVPIGVVHVAPLDVNGKVDAATGAIVQTDDPAEVKFASRRYVAAQPGENPKAVASPTRTLGVWVAALLTLCAFSYLYRDNPFYKLAEAVIVGVSAGYWIVLSFWEVLVAKVLVKLAPDVARYAFLPDTPTDVLPDYWYIVPVILGCLVFCRLVPRVAWLGRWPLAFVVGTTAGLKLVFFLDADFVTQIRSTIMPLIVFTADKSGPRYFDWKQSIQNIVFVFSVISSITYFYFSVEHKGWVGRISRLGVWVLMITFGASFALTVMGRITLLTMRLQFLFGDWLGLVKQ